MMARLGNVIYWATCGTVALVLAGDLFFLKVADHPDKWALFALILAAAAIIWVSGRAIRYVLAGR